MQLAISTGFDRF